MKGSFVRWALLRHLFYFGISFQPSCCLAVIFLVKIFSLDRRFKIKAPDLAVPFYGEGCMHCHAILRQFPSFLSL